MAVVNALPNGFLVVTLSPREAVAVMDQMLEPGDFPWQTSESQMISMEVRSKLKEVLEAIHQGQQDFLKQVMKHTEEHAHAQEKERRRQEAEAQAIARQEARERKRAQE